MFYTAKNNNAQIPGEWMIVFEVISDSGVLSKHRDVDPDPLNLKIAAENAESLLRCYLYAPHKENSLNWFSGIWDKVKYQECSNSPNVECLDKENAIYGCAFELDLATLTGEDAAGKLIDNIIEYRDAVLPKTKG